MTHNTSDNFSPRHAREKRVANQSPDLTAHELAQLAEIDRQYESCYGEVRDQEQRCLTLLERHWPDRVKVEGNERLADSVRVHFTFYCDCALVVEHAYLELSNRDFLGS